METTTKVTKTVKAQFEKKLGDNERSIVDDERSQVRVVDRKTQTNLPLKQVSFDVDVAQGFADIQISQVYANDADAPFEIVYKMPISESFSINSIRCRFLLPDGTETVLETQVVERFKAAAKYEDAVASGETAVMATLPPVHEKVEINVLTIYLGNFPAKSSLILTAKCSQKLDVQDLSYCFTIPMAFVPKYMAQVDTDVRTGVTLYSDAEDPDALEKTS